MIAILVSLVVGVFLIGAELLYLNKQCPKKDSNSVSSQREQEARIWDQLEMAARQYGEFDLANRHRERAAAVRNYGDHWHLDFCGDPKFPGDDNS